MNLKYLGDALDHWKGSLFDELIRAQLLRDLALDAMLTDAPEWSETDLRLYSRLLRVRPEQIIRHSVSLLENRRMYFEEIKRGGDIFVDPDTGIASGRVPYAPKYLFPAELNTLLASRQGVVTVYQHIGRQKTRQRLQILMNVLNGHAHSALVCCSYETPNAAMMFFSSNPNRVLAIHEFFTEFLGEHAFRRVSLWR